MKIDLFGAFVLFDGTAGPTHPRFEYSSLAVPYELESSSICDSNPGIYDWCAGRRSFAVKSNRGKFHHHSRI